PGRDPPSRQGVAKQPGLAGLARDCGAAVPDSLWLEDQRRQRAVGSAEGLKPAASTTSAASSKPAAIFEGSCASLANDTAVPPNSRHQRSTVRPGQSFISPPPRVVLTSSAQPRFAVATRIARSISS